MATTNYIWDPLNDSYLMEIDQAGVTTAVYTQEPSQYGGLISQRRGADTSYFQQDNLDGTRLLTDESGAVTDTFAYDAWGNEITGPSVATPFRWVGEKGYYFDMDLGSYYIRARTYSPSVSRWNSIDPMLFANRLLLYGYCGNSPVVVRDPSGAIFEGEIAQISGTNCPERDTVINSMNPTGGSSYPDGEPAPKLGITVISSFKGIVTKSTCGRYHWTITWWKPTPAPEPDGSFVLQHIIKTFYILDCCDNDITVKKMNQLGIQGNANGGKTLDFWEAWQFSPGKQLTDSWTEQTLDDTFGDPGFGTCTKGVIRTQGRYTEVAGKIPQSMPKGGVTASGGAPSSQTKPTVTEMGNYRQHNIVASWNCCPKGKSPS